MSAPCVAEALAEAREAGIDRLDAQLLLGHVLGQARGWLLTHDDVSLTDEQSNRFRAWVARRAAGEPLAYLVGEKEFHGLLLTVTPAVLIPRPDTETLVDWALELLRSGCAGAAPKVADLGTGSGAIALAIKHSYPSADVTGVDFSGDALAVAQSNAARLGLDVGFIESDWWQALPGKCFDLMLSNPPYIASGDKHLPALAHEPISALASGCDGLDAIRLIIKGASAHLQHSAWLLLEHGHDQAEAVATLLRESGFKAIASRHDLAGIARCTGGQRA